MIGFVGARTLFHLLTGRYHRPVIEKRVLAFIDIRNSTALVEELGALRGKEAISHVVTLVSRSVIEHGGDIYLYTGDGMIASWDLEDGDQRRRRFSISPAMPCRCQEGRGLSHQEIRRRDGLASASALPAAMWW